MRASHPQSRSVGGTEELATKKLNKKLNIRFITLCVGEDFFRIVKNGIRDASALMNADCSFVGTEDVDFPQQVKMVEEAIENGVDGIALNLADSNAFAKVIRKAAEAGIPVVAFNIDASEGKAEILGSVRQDVYAAGKILGQKSAERITQGSKLLATMHSDGVSALEARLKGIQESLVQKGSSWNVLTTGNVPAVAAERISAALAADPSIRAILCTGQADTEGAGLALERLPSEHRPYAAGFDLSPEILRLVDRGVIDFTIDQQPYLQGFLPVVQLVLNIRYGIRLSTVDAGAAVIDRSNVKTVLKLSRAGFR